MVCPESNSVTPHFGAGVAVAGPAERGVGVSVAIARAGGGEILTATSSVVDGVQALSRSTNASGQISDRKRNSRRTVRRKVPFSRFSCWEHHETGPHRDDQFKFKVAELLAVELTLLVKTAR